MSPLNEIIKNVNMVLGVMYHGRAADNLEPHMKLAKNHSIFFIFMTELFPTYTHIFGFYHYNGAR